MPIKHAIVHLIEKKPDGTPAVLHARDAELGDSQAIENLLPTSTKATTPRTRLGLLPGRVRSLPVQRLAR